MVELKEIILKNKKWKHTPINLSFDVGYNELDYSQKEIFKSLSLKEDYFLDGTFIVDGITFLPNNINSEETLCVLAISSQVFCLTLAFIINKKEKKSFIEDVQNKFLALKEMPLESFTDKDNKIKKIIENTILVKPSYVLLDLNDEINSSYSSLIEKDIKPHDSELTFIVLKKKEVEVEFSTLDIVNSDEAVSEDKNQKNEKKTVKNNFFRAGKAKLFLDILKKEYTSYLLIAFEVMFGVFSSLLFPSYFTNEDIFWGVILVIVSVLCIFTEIIFVALSIEPYLKKKKKDSFIVAIALLEAFTLIAIGIAYLLFVILMKNNVLVEQEKYLTIMFVPSIIISILSLLIIGLIKYISVPYFWLRKKLFNKISEDKKE